jgi:hypothetical protein
VGFQCVIMLEYICKCLPGLCGGILLEAVCSGEAPEVPSLPFCLPPLLSPKELLLPLAHDLACGALF